MRLRALGFTTAAVVAITLVTAPVHAVEPPAPKSFTFFWPSDKPVPHKISRAELDKTERQATVRTMEETAPGFRLRGNRKQSDYVFVTNRQPVVKGGCNGFDCQITDLGWVQIKQTIFGGGSDRWEMEVSAGHDRGMDFSVDTWYACAVNIPSARDEYCEDYRDDGADIRGEAGSMPTGVYYPVFINRGFGSWRPIKKFPMVHLIATWEDGSQPKGDDGDPGLKARMWDTCIEADSTKLCPVTGTGW
ncbi:hypothetical protein SMC26_25505 [Actinomadura fulvescens]|uniref:Secreted protein n=1 Tax=Actinomadura fulvescens TaxID=46160 RepID=A0ABN3Q6K1_9ACTN